MKINRNMSAVTANTQLLRIEKNLSASVQRLSSGYKLNKPGDNPAGMAISNKMKAQLRGLDQAENNVSDGVSVMQIADGALSEVTSCLQRMRELAVQANNGVYSREDKQSLQAEIAQLRKEIDRISSTTEYNTKTLLDGSSDVRTYADPQTASRIRISDSVVSGSYGVFVEAIATQATMPDSVPVTKPAADGTISVNGVALEVKASWTEGEYKAAVTEMLDEAGCTMEWTGTKAGIVTSNRFGTDATIAISMSKSIASAAFQTGATYDAVSDTYAKETAGTDAKVRLLAGNDLSSTATVSTEGNRVKIVDFNGFSIDFLLDSNWNVGATGADLTLDVTDIGAMTLQSGANQYQTMDLTIPEISATSLYLDEIDVTIVGGAGRALSTLDDAIERLNEVRSRIGAFQNRLESAQASLDEAEENMTSAYSTLLDTDMATEMVEYTQQNVLQQAATSVLAQANELPDTVLSLLRK